MTQNLSQEVLQELSLFLNLQLRPQSSYYTSIAICENGFEFPLVLYDSSEGVVISNQLFKFWLPKYRGPLSSQPFFKKFILLIESLIKQFPIIFKVEKRTSVLEVIRCSFRDTQISSDSYKFDMTTSRIDTEVTIHFNNRVFRIPAYLLLIDNFSILSLFTDYLKSIESFV